jgi:hypothetical protein
MASFAQVVSFFKHSPHAKGWIGVLLLVFLCEICLIAYEIYQPLDYQKSLSRHYTPYLIWIVPPAIIYSFLVAVKNLSEDEETNRGEGDE